ncbi:MAG: site-specific DNA-methyltransferase [FCB group bacterium]|nr:site-specific DNA-methyltransferase [FCB group bacterium]
MAKAKKTTKKVTKKAPKKTTKKNTPKKKDLTVADGIPVHCACDDIVPIAKIKPYPQNANMHPYDQVLLLAKLIHGNGWRGPITISNQSGFVVRGHGRLAAAKKLEAMVVPVDYQDYENEELERADRLADNKIQELSEWDRSLLKDELSDLDSGVLGDMDLTGFMEPDLEELMTAAPPPELNDGGGESQPRIEEAEELQKKWNVKKGQLWEMGNHMLLCGDCSEKSDIDKLLNGEKASMMFTDPPYGVSYSGKGKTKRAIIKNDDITESTLVSMSRQWFDGAFYATSDSAYWLSTIPQGPLGNIFMSDWIERGILRQVLIWVKNNFVIGHQEYHYQHEPILFGWKDGGDRLKNSDRTKTSLWCYDKPHKSDIHPTMKPVDMWKYGIENHSVKNDLIYEPFSGSGTSIIACEDSGRRCMAIEIDPKYVAVTLQRYHDETGNMPTLKKN